MKLVRLTSNSGLDFAVWPTKIIEVQKSLVDSDTEKSYLTVLRHDNTVYRVHVRGNYHFICNLIDTCCGN